MNKNDPHTPQQAGPKKALGKGLHALLPNRTPPPPPPLPPPETTSEESIRFVPIETISPNPDQPRREFNQPALMELAQSIERDGILQPLLVTEIGHNSYQIIAGERRWRAGKSAGLTTVPVIVRSADHEKALELALIENVQREDLNPIELATAFHRMASELGLSHEEIGQRTGKERTTITNAVRLLQLPQPLQDLVASKRLSAGHARALLKIEDESTQRELADRCIIEGWSVRQIEDFTKPTNKSLPSGKSSPQPHSESGDPNVKAAVQELEQALGTKVRILEKPGGRGHIEIEYYSSDDLSRIYDLLIHPE